MNLSHIEHLNPASILDCGANIGDWSREARHLWPEANIVMVEANPRCEPMLQAVGLQYHIAALGKERGKGIFYMQPGADTGTGNSFYRENTPFFDQPDTMELEIVTLDELFPDATFTLLKLDTQGSEIDILMGGKSLLSRAKAILLEVSVTSYNEGAPLREFVEGFMRASGFPNQQELGDITHPLDASLVVQRDVLFSR